MQRKESHDCPPFNIFPIVCKFKRGKLPQIDRFSSIFSPQKDPSQLKI